jgi:hypothetical protein
MKQLSPDQLAFLIKHNIPEELVFDANYSRHVIWQNQMRIEGKLFAFNVLACKKGNHELRSRSNHCIQCNSANIWFEIRHYSQGHIYIAGSKEDKIIKIGFTDNPNYRLQTLNNSKYGSASDWVMLFHAKCPNAGELERDLKSELKLYSFNTEYIHAGDIQIATELFKCNYQVAKKKLDSIVNKKGYVFLDTPWEYKFKLNDYE